MSAAWQHVPRSRLAGARLRLADKLVLWSVVIGAMIVAYGIRALRPELTSDHAWILPVVIFAGLGSYLLVVTLRARRAWQQFLADNNAAVEAQRRGEFSRARELLWRWAERTTIPRMDAVCRHNLVWPLMRAGELTLAIAVAADNEARNTKDLLALGLARQHAVQRALCEALAGNTGAAAARLRDAAQRPLGAELRDSAMTAFARAVVDCRSARHGAAPQELEERWSEYEAEAPGGTLRAMRVIRAFATSLAGPRSAGLAEAQLEGLRPSYPGEFAFLGVAWPEMAAFLATHRLAG